MLRANPGFEWVTFGDEHGSFVGATRTARRAADQSQPHRRRTRPRSSSTSSRPTARCARRSRDDEPLRPAHAPVLRARAIRPASACGRRRTSSSTRASPASRARRRCIGKDGAPARRGHRRLRSRRSCRSSCAACGCRPHSVVFSHRRRRQHPRAPDAAGRRAGSGSGTQGELLALDHRGRRAPARVRPPASRPTTTATAGSTSTSAASAGSAARRRSRSTPGRRGSAAMARRRRGARERLRRPAARLDAHRDPRLHRRRADRRGPRRLRSRA